MLIARLAAAALFATFAFGASSQTLRDAEPPAEFPPAGYTGTHYVDSKGCVYILAGQSGVQSWVPQVSRTRKQICGQKPTFGQTRRAVRAAKPTAKTKPARIVRVAPATAPVATGWIRPPNADSAFRTTPVPRGYRRAWEDDRLNPKRGHRTVQGEAQMHSIWTDTVPRQKR